MTFNGSETSSERGGPVGAALVGLDEGEIPWVTVWKRTFEEKDEGTSGDGLRM